MKLERRWVIAYVLSGVCALVVAGQFLYPGDRVLPFAKLNGQNVGLQTVNELEKTIVSQYGTATLTTHARDSTVVTPIGEAGLAPDATAAARALTDYPWYWRLVPLSIVLRGLNLNQPVTMLASGEGLGPYVKARVLECALPAKNASVTVRDGRVVLDPSKAGLACTEDSVRSQLLQKPLERGKTTEVTLATAAVAPTRSDHDVMGLLTKAQALVERPVQVKVLETVHVVEKTTVASWLTFVENDTSKQLEIGLNDTLVQAYLATIQKEVYVAPGVTVVNTFDGIETSRVVGAAGRGVELTKTTAAIREQVLGAGGVVTAEIQALPPSVRYTRSYSKTPAGFQALVNDLVAGKRMSISVRRLGDNGVSANGDTQYHPASTYKLFVAYSVLKRIDSGAMQWEQAATNGQTVSQCFDNMIVNSDNICAEWFGGSVIKWAGVEADARAIGAARTSFTKTATFLSTTNDLALFLQKLESNQLGLSEPSRGRLLDAMKRQRFRQGIPAGVAAPVADKVGFLDGWLHDAAIVYHPSGNYILVVMTENLSWAEIANVSRQVEKVMYP